MADRQMNQVDLAGKSGVAQQAISSYLRRSSKGKYPSYPTLVKLAKALRCDLYDLTGLEELRGVVVAPKLNPEVQALYDFYQSLPDDDSFKKIMRQKIDEMLRENEQNKGGSE